MTTDTVAHGPAQSETLAAAHQAADVLRSAIQQAHRGADPLLSLLLLPLIADAEKLESALGAIASAWESGE